MSYVSTKLPELYYRTQVIFFFIRYSSHIDIIVKYELSENTVLATG